MYRLGLVGKLVTHANMKGLGLTPLFGDGRGFMPPHLKTKQKQFYMFTKTKTETKQKKTKRNAGQLRTLINERYF